MSMRATSSRFLALTAALCTAATLAACSSSGGTSNSSATPTGSVTPGSPSPSSSTSSQPSSPTAATSPASTGTVAPRTLDGLLSAQAAAKAHITSLRLTTSVVSGSDQVASEVVERLNAGKITGIQATESLGPTGSVEVVAIGSRTWVKLPPAQRTDGKPWALATATSPNKVARSFAGIGEKLSQLGSVDLSTTRAAISHFQVLGPDTVDGVRATRYRLTVSVTKLPSSFPQRDLLVQSGLKSLPFELWLDGQGRPVLFTETLTVGGRTVTTKSAFSDYNAPVSISAPPASQVSG